MIITDTQDLFPCAPQVLLLCRVTGGDAGTVWVAGEVFWHPRGNSEGPFLTGYRSSPASLSFTQQFPWGSLRAWVCEGQQTLKILPSRRILTGTCQLSGFGGRAFIFYVGNGWKFSVASLSSTVGPPPTPFLLVLGGFLCYFVMPGTICKCTYKCINWRDSGICTTNSEYLYHYRIQCCSQTPCIFMHSGMSGCSSLCRKFKFLAEASAACI